MSLYTKNGEFPTQLPNRIKLSDGRTRTDKTTFTAEELADAGYVAVDNPPVADYPNKLEWTGTAWLVRAPNDSETNEKWGHIKHACKKALELTDYKVIKAVEAGTSISTDLVAYRQALRDLYNNVNDVDPWTVQFPELNVEDDE